jgi:hypothetical protein
MPGDSDVLRAVGFTEYPTSVCRASITDPLDAVRPPPEGPAPRLLLWLIRDGDRVIAIEKQYTP